jgi:hypothetical protein
MAEKQNVLREAVNQVIIEGILQEIRLEETTVNDKTAITGEIDIRTDDHSVHTLRVFSYKYKQDGSENSIYKGLQTVMNEYKSIAQYGKEDADKVRVTAGKLGVNEYYGQDGQLKTFPQLSTNFINRVQANDEFNPRAEFEVELYVHSVIDEIKNDEETGRAIIKGYLPLYGGKIVPLQFVVENEKAVDYVKDNYEAGSTVKIYGDIRNSVIVTKTTEEVAFGKPKEKIKSTTVREYVVTGGSEPYDEDDSRAYSKDVIKKALVERETYLEELKNKSKKESNSASNSKKGFDTKADTKPSKNNIADDLPF